MAKVRSDLGTPSCGNVFADLGLPNAEELLAKVRLAFSLNSVLASRKLTRAKAARVLGIDQAELSALKGYALDEFSLQRLMEFATALEHDVVIEIRPRPKPAGKSHKQIVGAA